MTTTKIAFAVNDDGRWTIEFNLTPEEETLLFGLTLTAGDAFDTLLDATNAAAEAIDLDFRLHRSVARH